MCPLRREYHEKRLAPFGSGRIEPLLLPEGAKDLPKTRRFSHLTAIRHWIP